MSRSKGIVPQRRRNALKRRAGYRCERCGRAGRLEIDHIKPVFRGGSNDDGNLQALCRGCHIAKTKIDKRPVSEMALKWRAFAIADIDKA